MLLVCVEPLFLSFNTVHIQLSVFFCFYYLSICMTLEAEVCVVLLENVCLSALGLVYTCVVYVVLCYIASLSLCSDT